MSDRAVTSGAALRAALLLMLWAQGWSDAVSAADAPGKAHAVRFVPVDEAARQPDFFTFRAQLQAAVARHDVAAVTAALSPDIINMIDGQRGVAEFRALWSSEGAGGTFRDALWHELATVLSLGGAFQPDGSFVAPYVSSSWPADVPDSDDAGELAVAIVGEGVRVRAAPAANAPVLATVGFVILPGASGAPDVADWMPVRLADGRTGFVARRYARTLFDHSATFSKADGHWQLSAFLEGD